ncbi:hypothetical protein BD769DRAFT_1673844 [Suillus cothurnatus]|nr:hypothetical protein BD769DRAFT_1673844 [Suillus cothurnatus]
MKALLSIYLVQTTTPVDIIPEAAPALIQVNANIVPTCSHRLGSRPRWSQPGDNALIIIFQYDGDGWFIKSVEADKYLGIEGNVDDAGDGSRDVAVPYPFKWDIRDSGGRRGRISLHDKKISEDLSDNRNETEGTQIQLRTEWYGATEIWVSLERNWYVDDC